MLCSKDHAISTVLPFCLACKVNMPYTDHFFKKKNNVAPKFWGKIPCQDVACLINFHSYSDVKIMMHRLKYKGRKDIGYHLGTMMGKHAKGSKFFKEIDLIVPIPLHPIKKMKRGYNQAASIGKGVSDILDIPMREDVIVKTKNTDSQTKKGRIARVKNVLDSFELVDKEGIKGRHILIVDDVITTGATIEACGNRLLESRGVKLSVLAACLARN